MLVLLVIEKGGLFAFFEKLCCALLDGVDLEVVFARFGVEGTL